MSKWHEGVALHAFRIFSMRFFALISLVVAVSPSLAQNNPVNPPDLPRSSPFQEKGSGFGKAPPGAGPWTPQRQTDQIEAKATRHEEYYGYPRDLERSYTFVVWDPVDAAEFSAMARYSLLLLSVFTQKSDELPLKRLYLRTVDREIPLLKVSSWRANVEQALLTHKMFGPYREDGFYLFPTAAYLRVGQIQADFAANRSGLPILEFPIESVPARLKNLQNPDPEPNALPSLKMVQAFIKRKTSGFPIPDSLPFAAYAKEPLPKSLPQAAASKNLSSLGDLFKK
jgi:hypothetical protein